MMPLYFPEDKTEYIIPGLFAFYLLSVLLPRGVCLFVYQKEKQSDCRKLKKNY